MAEFVLKNNYFEFNDKIKKHVIGTDIATYVSIFMDKLESDFLKS